MPKTAISVTLAQENLGWLRARAQATGSRSVSQVLDDLVRQARTAGARGTTQSVVGMVTIDPADPELLGADEAIRALFAASLSRPVASPRATAARPRRPARRG